MTTGAVIEVRSGCCFSTATRIPLLSLFQPIPSPWQHFRLLSTRYGCTRPLSYLYCAFFGGMCCAKVEFEGVCNEDWTTIDITVPIDSSNWSVETSTDNLEIPLRVRWEALDALLPHLPSPVRQETTFTIQRRSVRDYGKQRST